MEVQFGPNSVDEPSLLYKLQRKIKVFNTSDVLPNRGYGLVASSSKYGLVFVAVPDGTLSVYQLKQLVDKECEPQHVSVKLQEKPTHISVSCDYELLAVTGGQILSVYKVSDFQNPNVSPSFSIKTEVNPSTFVSALQWNPCIPDSIAIAYFDGTLIACMAGSGQVKKVPSKARCICWSPKGKQLVTGNSDGTLIQYKPELTAAKLIPAPNLFEGSPVEAMAIYWISTYQFAVVYKNATDNSRPAVTIINTPKAGQPSCISYEDICYSMGSNRPWYYYLQGLAQWNIIMTSSSNSMEIGTLGSADGSNWVQWCQSDEARPELPLTDKKVENYPVGLSIDTCAIHQLPWGENETLPFMPLLHVVSQNGLLTTFNVINMKKEAMQLCSPPQMLALPAQALTSSVPGAAPAASAPSPAPAPAQPASITPKPQPEISAIQQALQSTQPAPTAVSAAATIKIPSFTPQSNISFGAPAASQVKQEPKSVAENVPAPAPAPVAVSQPQHAAPPQEPHQSAAAKQQQAEEDAAKKAEQEKARKAKANQELKDMLVKEVNDFQMELYNFMVKTKETQARLQRDIDTISTNFQGLSLDTEELKKECSMEDLRNAIVQLKLELVRACAVVAEARTHSDAKDLHQWSQADPLTTKRVASVKKLAYYVQTQLAQAHAALDYKWNEIAAKDPQNNKPVKRMIRPILEDVYQPLVRQQEILSRQQAVLRTLKTTLAECDVGPVFKSTSLLRTPYRNNKDPLSKLTKNILNMSIESETKPKKPLLSAHKLDALRDALSNNKTAKVKPVNIELRQHLEMLRKNYEKSVKDKVEKVQVAPAPKEVPVKAQIASQPLAAPKPAPTFVPVASTKPVPASANVVRNLFSEEPKQDIPRPVSKPFEYSPATVAPVATNTKSVLKDVLTNKQANLDAKNNANTFMGQKICSPTTFGQPIAPTASSAPSAVFTSRPIADLNNMFNKLQPQPFVPETKSSLNIKHDKPASSNIKSSSETGEPESTAPKPMTNLFGMKTPLAASTPLTAPSKSTQETKAESKITVKPIEKLSAKENVPEKSGENIPKAVPKVIEKKEAVKPLASQANKGFTFGATLVEATGTSAAGSPKPLSLKVEAKPAPKATEKHLTTPASIFGTANTSISSTSKPQSAFTSPTITSTEPITPTSSEPSTPVKTSASSIFGAAVASEPKTTSSIFSTTTSVFTSPTTTPVFGAAFVTSAKTSAASVFKTATSAAPVAKSESSPAPAVSEAKTTASLFGSSSITITPVFGSSTSSTASIFGAPSPTVTTATVVVSSPSTTSSSVTTPTAVFTTSVTPAITPASVVASTTTPPTTTAVASVSSSTSVTSTTSVFGAALTSTNDSSVFGAAAASSPTTASIFGTAPPAVSSSVTPASVFGAASPSATSPTTAASIFGSAAASVPSSVFGAATTTTASVFGTTQPSVFGSKEAIPSAFTPTTTSIFGTATTQASSIFGQATQSVFGATTQASIFGATTQASVFGSPVAQTSVFGSPTTTQASVFGSPTQTTQASIFGTPTATSQPSVFGTQQTQSVFGSPTQTTQASVFGTPAQASIFGTPTQTTQASVFGTPTQATQASIFGTPTQTTQASIFGQPATTQSGGSLFGGGEANLFAAASISTTSASSPGSGGNIFGSPSGSVFGSGGGNVFGGKSTFGQPNPQSASIFGGGASFGQKPATNIWGSGSTGGGFGSTGFGQTATTQASSIFGGTTGGSFSQPSGGAFSSPPQQSAFGSPTQQQASAFGGGAVFGSKPVFGQPAGFGSPTSSGFGSSATFGGFNKSPGGSAFGAPAFGGASAFGGGSPGGGFAAPTQSNATFESLATQNTLTFGNLAQQSGSAPQPAAPSFNTSPSFTGWRG